MFRNFGLRAKLRLLVNRGAHSDRFLAMTRHEKILQKVLRGASDGNVNFDELCDLLRRLGFDDRHRGGSHRIFSQAGIVEIVNLQPLAGGRAKAYQVKQVRQLILKYALAGEPPDDDAN